MPRSTPNSCAVPALHVSRPTGRAICDTVDGPWIYRSKTFGSASSLVLVHRAKLPTRSLLYRVIVSRRHVFGVAASPGQRHMYLPTLSLTSGFLAQYSLIFFASSDITFFSANLAAFSCSY